MSVASFRIVNADNWRVLRDDAELGVDGEATLRRLGPQPQDLEQTLECKRQWVYTP